MTSQRPNPDVHSPGPPRTGRRRAAVILVAALLPVLAACQPGDITAAALGGHPAAPATITHRTPPNASQATDGSPSATPTPTGASPTGADPTGADPATGDAVGTTTAPQTSDAGPTDVETASSVTTGLSAASSSLAQTSTPSLGPAATSTGTTPAIARASSGARVLQTGVTVFAMWRDAGMADALFGQARTAGATWVRVDMAWCSVEEAGPGKVSLWYQNRLDAVVASAAAHHLKILIEISCTPAWARPGAGPEAYPTDPGQYRRITTYLAARYRGKVAAWEIWNEPDCIGGPCPVGDPVAYVPILKAGFRGVRAGDPGATVVSGGISGNNGDWIQRMYVAGAKGYFDALAVHPYMSPANAPPSVPSDGAQIYRLTNVAYVHYVMNYHGDGAKPIWFTEFGWTTSKLGSNPGVDEATQARYLQQSIEQIQQDYPYVTNAFWYSMRDRDDSSPYEDHFGLMRVDSSAKPSLAAFRSVNTWLARQ